MKSARRLTICVRKTTHLQRLTICLCVLMYVLAANVALHGNAWLPFCLASAFAFLASWYEAACELQSNGWRLHKHDSSPLTDSVAGPSRHSVRKNLTGIEDTQRPCSDHARSVLVANDNGFTRSVRRKRGAA